MSNLIYESEIIDRSVSFESSNIDCQKAPPTSPSHIINISSGFSRSKDAALFSVIVNGKYVELLIRNKIYCPVLLTECLVAHTGFISLNAPDRACTQEN